MDTVGPLAQRTSRRSTRVAGTQPEVHSEVGLGVPGSGRSPPRLVAESRWRCRTRQSRSRRADSACRITDEAQGQPMPRAVATVVAQERGRIVDVAFARRSTSPSLSKSPAAEPRRQRAVRQALASCRPADLHELP